MYEVKTAEAPLVRLGHVTKSFAMPDGSRFDAVKEVSLQIQRGDIVGLVGKSRAGKSTLLRLVNLLERPDTGTVQVAGRDLLALAPRELRAARRGSSTTSGTRARPTALRRVRRFASMQTRSSSFLCGAALPIVGSSSTLSSARPALP